MICLDEFGGYTGTYILDLRGQYVRGLPLTGEPKGSPTWTSGNTVVWAQAGLTESDPTTLWEAEVGGTEATQLTDGSGAGTPTRTGPRRPTCCCTADTPRGRSFGALLTMDHDGDPGPGTEGVEWGHPAWSPDGTRVVFTIRDEDGTEQLAVGDDRRRRVLGPEPLPDLPGDQSRRDRAWGTPLVDVGGDHRREALVHLAIAGDVTAASSPRCQSHASIGPAGPLTTASGSVPGSGTTLRSGSFCVGLALVGVGAGEVAEPHPDRLACVAQVDPQQSLAGGEGAPGRGAAVHHGQHLVDAVRGERGVEVGDDSGRELRVEAVDQCLVGLATRR